MNCTVEITETSVLTYEILNVASVEEATEIAMGKFEDGDEPDDVDVLELETEAFEQEGE